MGSRRRVAHTPEVSVCPEARKQGKNKSSNRGASGGWGSGVEYAE